MVFFGCLQRMSYAIRELRTNYSIRIMLNTKWKQLINAYNYIISTNKRIIKISLNEGGALLKIKFIAFIICFNWISVVIERNNMWKWFTYNDINYDYIEAKSMDIRLFSALVSPIYFADFGHFLGPHFCPGHPFPNDSWTTNKRKVCDASKNEHISFITKTAKPRIKIKMNTTQLINIFIAFCDNYIKRNIFLANYIRIFRFCRFLPFIQFWARKKRIIKN